MLALCFTFTAGRYHGTPWYRHVNEGAVEWPPSPWRILRGLIATWHHKVKYTSKHSESTLLGLIESLAQELPEYGVPAASHSHTRHYMPQYALGKAALVFDAFTAVRADDPLIMVWRNVELLEEHKELLDSLLSVMGYLGRAESWVEARRLTEAPVVNCGPDTGAPDTETGEARGEPVTLYAPLTPNEYHVVRQQFLADRKAGKKLAKTLPDDLLQALSVDTAELRRLGWNQPPATRRVSYVRPLCALQPSYANSRIEVFDATTASFIVLGKPLPRVEETLRIGELMRMAVMSRAKRLYGEDGVPATFSGHDLPEGNRHRHSFYLPWDSNDDGRIDRVLLHVPDGMRFEARRIVEEIERLWSRGGREWRLVLESVGRRDVASGLTKYSRAWESVTPYLHPWHVKKRFAIGDQIKRECRERGLPEPTGLERFPEVEISNGRKLRAIDYRRFRSHRGLTQPDRLGSFWRLTFAEPVHGPLALGFACHFGLGLFRPAQEANCASRVQK